MESKGDLHEIMEEIDRILDQIYACKEETENLMGVAQEVAKRAEMIISHTEATYLKLKNVQRILNQRGQEILELGQPSELAASEKKKAPQSANQIHAMKIVRSSDSGIGAARAVKTDDPSASTVHTEKSVGEINPLLHKELFSGMQQLYSLENGENHFLSYSGNNPMITFMQDGDPILVRKMFDIGSIAAVFLSGDLRELSKLPPDISKAVKSYTNKDFFKKDSVACLKFLSAGPTYEGNIFFPAYHFIEIIRVKAGEEIEYDEDLPKKIFEEKKWTDKFSFDRRRAIGLQRISSKIEKTLEKGRVWYNKEASDYVITSWTPKMSSVTKIKLQKIQQKIQTGQLAGSQATGQEFCKISKHPQGSCQFCGAQAQEKGSSSDLNPSNLWEPERKKTKTVHQTLT